MRHSMGSASRLPDLTLLSRRAYRRRDARAAARCRNHRPAARHPQIPRHAGAENETRSQARQARAKAAHSGEL